METTWRSILTVVAVSALLATTSACVSESESTEDQADLPTVGSSAASSPAAGSPTVRCEEAFADAEVRLDAHYAKWEVLDPSGFDQEEAEWSAAIDPVYDECASAADFMAAGKLYPAVFGLTGAEFVDVMTVQIYCSGHESRISCEGVDQLS